MALYGRTRQDDTRRRIGLLTAWAVLCSTQPLEKASNERLAQVNIPSAGTVLGWELNMNQRWTPRLEPGGPSSTTPTPGTSEAPVIFYEPSRNPDRIHPSSSPYLLNTPSPKGAP